MCKNELLSTLKRSSQFECVIAGNKMLSYNKSLKPVAHYEVADNKLFVVQFNRSYTEIKAFAEFMVESYNTEHNSNFELVFEFVKIVNAS